MDILCREARPDELEKVIATRNLHFPPIDTEAWFREESMTAAVAISDGEFVGAIPLAIRELQVTSGRTITAAFENAVLVVEELRSRGIGAGMIEAAREFLKDRCDALCVYRGHERSQGYKFYAKTQHVDLHYLREYTDDKPNDFGAAPNLFSTTDPDRFFAPDRHLLEVYDSMFADMGGFPKREQGYWRKMVNGHIYAALPTDFTYLWYEEDGEPRGYCICGRRRASQWTSENPSLQILEMATWYADRKIAQALFQAVSTEAAKMGCSWSFQGNGHPLLPVATALGTQPAPREKISMIMGQLLEPESFGRHLRGVPSLRGVEVRLWTPGMDFVLKSAETPSYHPVTLEMKEETMVRFLLCRIDLLEAIGDERITVSGATDTILKAISMAFPKTQWVHHPLDYI